MQVGNTHVSTDADSPVQEQTRQTPFTTTAWRGSAIGFHGVFGETQAANLGACPSERFIFCTMTALISI